MSNSLDPDQPQLFVGPDLGLNCLQRLSADNTSRQRVKVGMVFGKVNCFIPQTQKLVRERLGDSLRVEDYTVGKCLVASYWR